MPIVRTKRMLDTRGVEALIAAAKSAATSKGYRVVIVVVDASGRVLALTRTEGSQAASDQVAIDKARTAAIFIRPSREIEQQVTDGRLGALALHGARALTGGVPVSVGGEVVGAIGTSGETPDQDEWVSLAGTQAQFSTVEVPALTHDGAQIAAQAVAAEATGRGVTPVAAVVDAGGHLMHLWRPDHAQVASVGVATDKARTASIFRRPSKDFEDQASGGRPSALHLADAVPLQGGMPIVIDGHVVGAIGVSGASSADEDQELAVLGQHAVQAGAASQNEAVLIPSQHVEARFETGGLLLDTPRYKLDAGRRTGPGDSELHESVVDIMRVVRGTAKVTAGTTSYELSEGDVLVIPNGVPHQFVDASDPFLYFVTKVEV
jgi:uncharacterized protein GlcG (DUF336 family)